MEEDPYTGDIRNRNIDRGRHLGHLGRDRTNIFNRQNLLNRPRQDRAQRDGPRQDRPQRDGPRQDRPQRDGPRQDRPQRDGPRQDRPQRDGPRQDRPRQDRPQRDGPQRDGPRQDGPRQDRPQRDGPQRDRPQRPDHPAKQQNRPPNRHLAWRNENVQPDQGLLLNEDHGHFGPVNRNRRHNRDLGYKALEGIALSDPVEVFGKINERKESLLNLIEKNDNPDMHVLIIQILYKACLSSFDELKMRFLWDICNTEYLKHLQLYLIDLPYKKNITLIYWRNPNEFWKHLIQVWETIFNIMPSVALDKCRPMIEVLSNQCLGELHKRHTFVLSDENLVKLDDLRNRLENFEKKSEEEKQQQKARRNNDDEAEPPEDFRQMSVIPSRDELLDQKPFVRANVVRGGYRSVDHYLDVQFRLLREDCFGPLREGLYQYFNDPQKKKYDNMRVYKNVKFIGPYTSNTKTGFLIQLDANTIKSLKKINWNISKRFIFGSLLLFSNDNCNSFITASILDRDVKYLSQGMIPVSIIGDENITSDPYIMFESAVYFEPYLHVLKVLQHRDFGNDFAMKKYIVDVEPEVKPPIYLQQHSEYRVETIESPTIKFKVLEPHTWPTHEQLQLNESQFEAYHLALTHEFAVIQGPPGTGKTHLGVRVAKTLIENIQRSDCLLLVVCYTNHALDQFLEHILNITSSIVRIGGRSKNEAMEKISLNNLRRTSSSKRNIGANKLFFSEKRNLQMIMGELKTAQRQIESISNGILTYDTLCAYIPEIGDMFRRFNTNNGEDKILVWLLQDVNFAVDVKPILEEYVYNDEEYPIDKADDEHERTSFVLDDLENEIKEFDIGGIEVKTTFMYNDANQKIKQLVSNYNTQKSTLNRHNRQLLENEIRYLHTMKSTFLEMKHRHEARRVPRPVREGELVTRLPNEDRWAIYFTWANIALNKIREHIAPLEDKLANATATYEEARMNLDLVVLGGVKVVGMTTSGAARLRKLLVALKPPIVIVEEAAEVLEQHIVTSLTRNCQHLILIGDHQQLRPSAAYMRLARHYNIEVSLFERMILNQMHSRRLRVQHRMRPEISALISPHIYSDLMDHPSVEGFPSVRGVICNLFFYTHNHKEDDVEESASKSNREEADLVLSLANYLMQQNYKPEDVTILSAYSGQMFYMRKERQKYAFLDKVKITVVDNYQGEESKIILLSLVRNNNANKIGFLGTENRICVALSRAKEGFFIFGNIHLLKEQSPLWTKISETLEKSGGVGTSIMLKCENHPNQISTISSVKDFNKVPEGGCRLPCNHILMACGHPCPRICHGYDRDHANVACQRNCERVICTLNHACPLKCADKCRPCNVKVPKMLPCGHEKAVSCHMEPTDPKIKCITVVTIRLKQCGHEVKKPCHVDPETFQCPVPCPQRVEGCGHTCRRRCHVDDDPDHERYICTKTCAKAKKGCTANLVGDRANHQCNKQCHEECDDCNVEVIKKRSTCKHSDRVVCCKNVDENPCRQKCARLLPCGHFCKKKCFEKCGDCKQKVKKRIEECGHTVEVECMVEPTRAMCRQACEATLECGHACARPCAEPCSAAACRADAPASRPAPCGHRVQLPCNVYRMAQRDRLIQETEFEELLLAHCTEPCGAVLSCEHACAGSCSGCRQGRLHMPCMQKCHVQHICGHQCKEPCNQICPPCKQPCQVKCRHSKCSKLCGALCTPCQEKCSRACPHGACTRRCGEPCSRPPCDQPCPRALPCGHACRGLCGEPCPPICRLCSPDTFPKDFLGDDFDDDAKFIKLQDCSHIMEVEDADNLMNGDRETISIRSCPFCRTPIINTHRYKDRVNEMYLTEINPIKEKVYGTAAQIDRKWLELKEAFDKLQNTHGEVIQENKDFKMAFHKIQTVVRQKNKISLLQLQIHFVYINTMDIIGEKVQQFKKEQCQELEVEFCIQIKIICDVLISNIKKLSQQQQEDISNEIKRMNSIIQLSKIVGHTAYKCVNTKPQVVTATKTAQAAVLSWKVYNEDVAIAALKKLQDEINVHGIVTKEERNMIVKAIGLKHGHWFKCPNGHFYCIGECGGAMEESKCNECGAKIGGTRHALLSTNAHAGEMDGSQYAAWPQEMNVMRQFHMNDH